jgi:hypothetical protein
VKNILCAYVKKLIYDNQEETRTMLLFVLSAFVILVIVQLCSDLSAWKKKKDEEWKKLCHVLTSEQRAHISSLESENLKLENDCSIYEEKVGNILEDNNMTFEYYRPEVVCPLTYLYFGRPRKGYCIEDVLGDVEEDRFEFFSRLSEMRKNEMTLSESCISKLYDLHILYHKTRLEIGGNEQTIYYIKNSY